MFVNPRPRPHRDVGTIWHEYNTHHIQVHDTCVDRHTFRRGNKSIIIYLFIFTPIFYHAPEQNQDPSSPAPAPRPRPRSQKNDFEDVKRASVSDLFKEKDSPIR